MFLIDWLIDERIHIVNSECGRWLPLALPAMGQWGTRPPVSCACTPVWPFVFTYISSEQWLSAIVNTSTPYIFHFKHWCYVYSWLLVVWCVSSYLCIRCVTMEHRSFDICSVFHLALSIHPSIHQSINQERLLCQLSSTVINIQSNHDNVRHNRNKWKQKAYR